MCARKARATTAPAAKPATKRCWRSISKKSLEEEPIMASSPTATSCLAWNGADDKKKGEEKKSKCELIRYEALPDWLKDNEFIHGYYRCEWPMKETILSIFSIHNETLNVWSHLIGFLLFLCLTIFTAMVIPRDGNSSSSSWSSRSSSAYWGDLVEMANITVALRHEALAACFLLPPSAAAGPGLSEDDRQQIPTSCPPNKSSSHHRHHGIQIQQDTTGAAMDAAGAGAGDPVTRWPLFAYLGGAMVCLLTSSACHLILCHSERTAYVTLRLDYAGIAALIVTSFYPLAYYSFLCAGAPPAPRRALLVHGRVRGGAHRAQARALRRDGPRRRGHGGVRGAHGRALRARRRRVRGARARAVGAREVRPRRAQPPAVPPLRRRRRVRALPRRGRVPQVEGPGWMYGPWGIYKQEYLGW
ncbi:hypothetical protein PVAP13_3NG224263 [Panicum virgatum]|uniref:Uncharacterized protein n=1 Tax=Panicum virgatum TaxID=38727 RepID=A0A8T0UKM0_PANVG|nr:hypothetical protein PVAP13_3NG224263 [Panicum virgatum]